VRVAVAEAEEVAEAAAGAPGGAGESESPVRPGRQRRLLTATLMLCMGVVALEGTVVTTALPSVVGELQGLTLYPWVFSVYLLTSTTSVPVYGKLADVYGRKPLFLLGLLIFLLGTLLCGASESMVQLVAFRALQGLGAGAVLPLTLTVLSDIYALPERARVQPLTASVWGVLSLTGPAAGAAITETLSWRWVFWVNVPVCLVALALLSVFLKERVHRRRAAVDYAGAVTLTLGLVAALLAVLEGGRSIPFDSWLFSLLVGSAVLLFALFVAVERRAPDPVLPFSAFRLRPVAVSNVGNMLLGVILYGLTSFLPLFAQGVRGESAAGASAVLTPLLVGWSLAALGSGRLYLRFGFRATAALGTFLIALGVSPLVLVGPQTPLLAVAVPMGIAGVGLGTASPAFLLAPQSAVPWHLRGAVTSSTQFARTIGGSLGVALLGALLNARLGAALAGAPGLPGASGVATGSGPDALVSALLQPATRAALPPEMVQALSAVLAGALHAVYVALALLALVGLGQVLLFAGGGRAGEAPLGDAKGGP
jgi:EmrB/QacA subfamily drug resistance transporter